MESAVGRAFGWKIQIAIWFLLLTEPHFALSEPIRVCSKCAYTSIQKAIDVAPEGSTIEVLPGIYQEKTLVINKTLKLVGKSSPVIDGQNQRHLLVIFKANDVVITGFTFKNTGVSFTSELAAIRVVESQRCQLSGNLFLETTYGVYLEKSHQCRVTNNQFQGQAKDEASGGNGVHVWTGSEHWIEDNQITGHRDGIYLEFVKSSTINRNKVHGNLRYGLHFMFSNSTHASENIFQNNGSGVAIMYSQDIVMEKNSYQKNKGNASYGLLLKDINSSKIVANRFLDNTVAIYMEGSNRSQIIDNQMESNGYGLRIMGNCENNEFRGNNFVKNSFDVTTNSSMSWNVFQGNYWSKYAGYDLNQDQVGDIPFRPVSLSSVVVESVDTSFYLIGSFLFDLLDFVERALPELTPDTLKDEMPLMKPKLALHGESHD